MIVLVFFTTALEAINVRSIRVQTLVTEAQAKKSLLKFMAFVKTHSNILSLQKEWNFEFKVIKLGKYHVITIEPLIQDDVVKELLDTIRVKYRDSYAKKIKLAPVIKVMPEVIVAPVLVENIQIGDESLINESNLTVISKSQSVQIMKNPADKVVEPTSILVTNTKVSNENITDKVKVLQTKEMISYYNEGVAAYKAKDYEGAIEFFKASKGEYTNINMQLLWAKSEEALFKQDMAIAAYERVVMLEPKNLEAAIKLIEFYKKNGQDEEATQVASGFDDKDLSPEQRSALSALLSVSNKKLDKFSGFASVKIGYDSNIASRPDEGSLDAFASNLNLTQIQRDQLASVRGAFYSQALVSFSYLHDLTHIGGWFIKSDVTGMAQININESFYNTKYIQASVGVGYKISNTTS